MTFKPIEAKNRGRPRLLDMDDSVAETLADYLREGLYMREACALAGVSRDSVYSWLKQGTKDRKEGIESPEAAFSDIVKRAMAEAEADAVKRVRAAGAMPQFWQAEAWFLERRYPDKYGKRDRVALEHSGQMGIGVATVDKPLSERLNDEDKREAAKDIARSLAIIGSGTGSPIRGADSLSEPSDEWEGEDSEASSLPEWETN